MKHKIIGLLLVSGVMCAQVDQDLLARATQELMGGITPGRRGYITELLVAYQANPNNPTVYEELIRALYTDIAVQAAKIEAFRTQLAQDELLGKTKSPMARVQDMLEQILTDLDQLHDKLEKQAQAIVALQQAQTDFSQAIVENQEDTHKASQRFARGRHR